MSVVNILNIQVLDNPTRFTNPFQFEITFECTSALQDDLEWKIVYVGSPEDESYDQTLDCIMVGPVPIGLNKFVYQADAPNPAKIPAADLIGVTVVLIICSYRDQEFVRVGYYVNNEYEDELLKAEPPATPQIDKLVRNILADKPRVTRFPIKWDTVDELEPPQELTNLQEQPLNSEGEQVAERFADGQMSVDASPEGRRSDLTASTFYNGSHQDHSDHLLPSHHHHLNASLAHSMAESAHLSML